MTLSPNWDKSYGKTNCKETFLNSESSLLVVGGREATLVQMTVPMLLGHAFAEVTCLGWPVGKIRE